MFFEKTNIKFVLNLLILKINRYNFWEIIVKEF